MPNMPVTFTEKESVKIGNIALLGSIFSLVFLIPLFDRELHRILHNVLITTVFLITILAMNKNRKRMLYFVIILIIIEWISSEFEWIYLTGLSRIGTIIFFVIVVFRLIFQAARARDVNLNVVLESINGYLLLGIVFSIMVKIVSLFIPEAYNFPPGVELSTTQISYMSEFYYYGFVTYTTLGYGDLLPQIPLAKSLAILTSISGQIYLAVIIAMLVGKYASRGK